MSGKVYLTFFSASTVLSIHNRSVDVLQVVACGKPHIWGGCSAPKPLGSDCPHSHYWCLFLSPMLHVVAHHVSCSCVCNMPAPGRLCSRFFLAIFLGGILQENVGLIMVIYDIHKGGRLWGSLWDLQHNNPVVVWYSDIKVPRSGKKWYVGNFLCMYSIEHIWYLFEIKVASW